MGRGGSGAGRVWSLDSASGSVLAIQFETEAAPFVVKNAAYGKSGGGSVELEVPWREGTGTRTARRIDLIRMLERRGNPPDVEVLSARCHPQGVFGIAGELSVKWLLMIRLYLIPSSQQPLAIPHHRCELLCSRELWTSGLSSILPRQRCAQTGIGTPVGNSHAQESPP